MKTIDIADVERGSSDIKSPARLALAQTGSPHEDEPLEQQTTHKRKLAETESGEEDKVIPQSSPPREEQIQQLKDNKIVSYPQKLSCSSRAIADAGMWIRQPSKPKLNNCNNALQTPKRELRKESLD